MFDIEQAIESWRQGYATSDSVRHENVLELETHLRELVAELRVRHFSDEEAFVVATHRLGDASELGDEFAKVNAAAVWRKRVLWMMGGYLAYSVFGALIGSASQVTTVGLALADMGGTVSGIAGSIVAAIGWSAVLAFAYFQSRRTTIGSPRMTITKGVVVGLVIVGSGILQIGGSVLFAQALGPAEFGASVKWSAYGAWVVRFCVFVATVTLMCTLNAKKNKPELAA